MTMIAKALATCSLAMLVSTSAIAQGKKAEVLGQPGNWRVQRTKDAMTDKISCWAVYRGKPNVQLYHDGFYISYRGRGGVDGYQIRFDDTPAAPLRLPNQIEKEMGTIIFSASDLRRLVKSKRLRIQGLTVLRTLIAEDLDLNGIEAAYKLLSTQGCRK